MFDRGLFIGGPSRHLVLLVSLLTSSFTAVDSFAAPTAQDLLQRAGVRGGFVVHLGCGDGQLTGRLRAGEAFQVQGLTTSGSAALAARESLRREGRLGPVTIDTWDGRRLPYADNLVNLLIVTDRAQATEQELMRVLAPRGVLLLREGSNWKKTAKAWPASIDEWTHYLHGPDGNPVAHDKQVGPPNSLRWIGLPRWSRHHDHMASMNALVSAGGRLFYILDEGSRTSIQLPSRWRLIARDAFNGMVLWKRDIEHWNTRQYPLKSGPAHLLRRLVAEGDRVYVTLGIDQPVVELDAASGRTLKTYPPTRYGRELLLDDGVLFVLTDSAPSKLPSFARVSTYVWENTRTANPKLGWHGAKRKIVALDAASGKQLWQAEAPVAPCSMAVDDQRLVFHDGTRLVSLDRRTGEQQWQSTEVPTRMPVETNTGPRIVLYDDVVLLAPNNGKITGWSAADGKLLWEQRQLPSGHLSLKDLMVVNGLVWTAAMAGNRDSGEFIGYDPRSGAIARRFQPDVQVHWFHHRCYPAKATDDFILTARNGTEFVDLEREHWKPHHWVRGGCIYGVMPCNGLMYASMDACGCQLEAKLPGFKALAAADIPQPTAADRATRLQRGPAYGQVNGPAATADDWPTYRHDAGRSGASRSTVGKQSTGTTWQARLGGRLTPPTIAADIVFVAQVDQHTVHAFELDGGKRLWSYATGGRIDSPPTYYRGLLLCGSADGYVYALRARDGQLAWRLRAAPVDRRLMAWEQLESVWPVHGSVLVEHDVAYCTAGRSIFLDGGIHFLKLNPWTGEILNEVVWNDKDPVSGEDMHLAYLKKTSGNNMPVALSDILSSDGRNLWMRSQKIDFDGHRHEIGLQDVTQQPAEDCHLFCQVGYLDDSYFFRSYWTFGRRVSGGYGAWLKAGRLVPSGRILCFDDDYVFGFGRKPAFMTNASVLQYEIYSAKKEVTREAIQRITKAERTLNSQSPYRNGNSSDWLLRYLQSRDQLSAVEPNWTVSQPAVTVRAMALTADSLVLAGPPNFVDERQVYRRPSDPAVLERVQKQQEAIEGKCGGELWFISKVDGQIEDRFALDSFPVFDGMAVAGGRLLLSTIDGRVVCLAGRRANLLQPVGSREPRVEWPEPENRGYLLPPAVPKEDDFDVVSRCGVVESKLGYQVVPKSNGGTMLALNKLPRPIRGQVKITTQLQVPGQSSTLQNGFLVFGDGPRDPQLVKIGGRWKMQKALLIQGELTEGKSRSVNASLPVGKPVTVSVTVNLAAHQVTARVNDVTIKADLPRTLDRITHVGIAASGSKTSFAPIQVETIDP